MKSARPFDLSELGCWINYTNLISNLLDLDDIIFTNFAIGGCIIKVTHLLLLSSQSDYLIRVFDRNSHS